MAKNKRILALDVGTSRLKLGEFLVEKDGALTLINFGSADLGMDPSDEDSRSVYIVNTIQELMEERGIAPAPTMVAVPGQSVFSRYVKLPQVEPDKIFQIVQYEAAQNVPFPIEEVVWDYQLIGQDADELDVLLVAMKQELIDDIAQSIGEAGLNTDLVDVAPMAITNAYRHSYSDQHGCALVLDMGARSTDLIFIEGDRVFNRSIPIAGNTITQAVMKEFNVSFDDAEEMKKEHAFVAFGGAYERHDDPTVDAVSKCVRSVMTRMHAEINRSINFYRGQQGGSKPEHLLLTGGTSTIPHIDTFLNEKLNLPVEYLNPFAAIQVAPEVDEGELSAEGYGMSEVVGLGLRSSMVCPIELNLMPPEIIKQKKLRKKQPVFVTAAALIALSVLVASLFQLVAANKKAAHLDEVDRQVQNLKQIENQVKQASRSLETVNTDIAALTGLHEQRGAWSELLKGIGESIPAKGIWITGLSALPVEQEAVEENSRRRFQADEQPEETPKLGTIIIEGLGYVDRLEFEKARQYINTFSDNLKETGLFGEEGVKFETPSIERKDFVRSYRITATLKEPIAQ